MVTGGRVTAYRLISIEHKGNVKSNKIVIMLDGDLFVVAVNPASCHWCQHRRCDAVKMVRQFDIAPKVRVGRGTSCKEGKTLFLFGTMHAVLI